MIKLEIKDILKSMSGYSIGVVFTKVIPIFSIPIILKNISVEQYGTLGDIMSIILVFVSLGSLSISSSNFRFFRHTNLNFSNNHNQKLISSSNLVLIFGTIISALICIFFLPRNYLLPGIVFIITQAIYSYFIALIRLTNKVKYYNVSEVGKQLIYLFGLFFLEYLGFFNVFNIIMLLGLINLPFIFFFTYHFSSIGWIKLIYSKEILINTLRFSTPLIIAYCGQIFIQQSPILLYTGDSYGLGLINFSNKIAMIIFAFQAVIFLAWPFFAYKYQKEKIHQTIFKTLTVILLFFLWLIYLFFEEITLFIANEEYLSSKNLVIGFLSAFCLSIVGNFIDTSASIQKNTKLISLVFISGIFILLFSHYFLNSKIILLAPYLPVLIAFSSMLILRVFIYKYKKQFISWDNNFLILLILNLIILMFI